MITLVLLDTFPIIMYYSVGKITFYLLNEIDSHSHSHNWLWPCGHLGKHPASSKLALGPFIPPI